MLGSITLAFLITDATLPIGPFNVVCEVSFTEIAGCIDRSGAQSLSKSASREIMYICPKKICARWQRTAKGRNRNP